MHVLLQNTFPPSVRDSTASAGALTAPRSAARRERSAAALNVGWDAALHLRPRQAWLRRRSSQVCFFCVNAVDTADARRPVAVGYTAEGLRSVPRRARAAGAFALGPQPTAIAAEARGITSFPNQIPVASFILKSKYEAGQTGTLQSPVGVPLDGIL